MTTPTIRLEPDKLYRTRSGAVIRMTGHIGPCRNTLYGTCLRASPQIARGLSCWWHGNGLFGYLESNPDDLSHIIREISP